MCADAIRSFAVLIAVNLQLFSHNIDICSLSAELNMSQPGDARVSVCVRSCLCLCLSVDLSVCLSVYLRVCVCVCVCMCVCVGGGMSLCFAVIPADSASWRMRCVAKVTKIPPKHLQDYGSTAASPAHTSMTDCQGNWPSRASGSSNVELLLRFHLLPGQVGPGSRHACFASHWGCLLLPAGLH